MTIGVSNLPKPCVVNKYCNMYHQVMIVHNILVVYDTRLNQYSNELLKHNIKCFKLLIKLFFAPNESIKCEIITQYAKHKVYWLMKPMSPVQ